jgi:hypothetical protein
MLLRLGDVLIIASTLTDGLMDQREARYRFVARVVGTPLLFVALAISILAGDWRLILLSAVFIVLQIGDLIWERSVAFPNGRNNLAGPFQRLSTRLSHAQTTAIGLGLSLLLLGALILLLGSSIALFALAGTIYAFLLLRLMWIVYEQGWSGTKRRRSR